MTYSLVDVIKRKEELKAAMPELELFDHGDFGRRLEAHDPVSGVTVVVMRPYRSIGKSIQAEMNQPTEPGARVRRGDAAGDDARLRGGGHRQPGP